MYVARSRGALPDFDPRVNAFTLGRDLPVPGARTTLSALYPRRCLTPVVPHRLQERFLIDTADNATAADPPSDTWPVGVTYVTESSKDFGGRVKPVAWCGSDAYHACVVPAPRDDVGWYVFNVRSTGKRRSVDRRDFIQHSGTTVFRAQACTGSTTTRTIGVR